MYFKEETRAITDDNGGQGRSLDARGTTNTFDRLEYSTLNEYMHISLIMSLYVYLMMHMLLDVPTRRWSLWYLVADLTLPLGCV